MRRVGGGGSLPMTVGAGGNRFAKYLLTRVDGSARSLDALLVVPEIPLDDPLLRDLSVDGLCLQARRALVADEQAIEFMRSLDGASYELVEARGKVQMSAVWD